MTTSTSNLSKTITTITVALSVACALSFIRIVGKSHEPRLSFNADGQFKILHLTDLHLGEDPFSDWGPEADRKTLALIHKLMELEKPNLVILGGDQITGNNIDANATLYYDKIANVLESFRTPYALIFGNHDDADFEPPMLLENKTNLQRRPAKTCRQMLLRSDQRHRYSLAQAGPPHVFGVSNYMLPVYSHKMQKGNYKNHDSVALQIVLLDSGGGSLIEQIDSSQLDDSWYRLHRLTGVDAVAFQHIPTQAFLFNQRRCTGFVGEGIAPIKNDSVDEISTLLHNDLSLRLLAVGHNHGNSYCCFVDQGVRLYLCFGRHSGYGGYGTWQRGARVFEITETVNEDGGRPRIKWKSWVRLEDETKVNVYYPNDAQGVEELTI